MSEDKEFGLTNSGDDIIKIPVELKDHSKDPVLVDVVKEMEKQTGVPKELVTPVIEKKKRGRPKKVVPSALGGAVEEAAHEEEVVEIKAEKTWYCSTCRETIMDHNVMRIGAGDNRWAVFCPQCQKSLGFLQPDVDAKIADLIRHNSTGK